MSSAETIVPAQDGLYRIKVRDGSSGLCLELQPDKTVKLSPIKESSAEQTWSITSSYTTIGVYKVTSSDGKLVLTVQPSSGHYYVVCEEAGSTTWKIESHDSFSKIFPSDPVYKDYVVDCDDQTEKADLREREITRQNQHWIFEHLDIRGPRSASGSFQARFFGLTVEEAKKEGPYDIIIIGSGIGGGVLAADLFETNHKLGKHAKKVLLIEKGNLIFHSHCLNASRPTGHRKDRDQQNDWFFAQFKSEYSGAAESAKGDWKGGPLYCLGGRSAAWGLAAPRIHDQTLDDFFPKAVATDLLHEYYEKAEKLVKLSLPMTKPEHQHLMDRLNITAKPELDISWEWGRIASEFREARNFDFAEGAYSSIDKLLEIAMNKPEENGRKQEHSNFKMLLSTEAREILWDDSGSKPAGVRVKTIGGETVDLDLVPATGRVVVSAGSVHSAAILLRSQVDLRSMGGCRVTDHDILFKSGSFRYKNPHDRADVGSMKFQSYIKLPNSDVALANMSIDASSFLPRGNSADEDLPKFIMVYIMRVPLERENNITLDKNQEPIVTIKRSSFERGNRYKAKLQTMEDSSRNIMKVIEQVLKVDFVKDDHGEGQGDQDYFGRLKLGGVAHELGSIPMQNPDLPQDEPYCVEHDLKLRGYENVYVCDLSVFPYSPEVNPTLTLTALSLRLSHTLVPREPVLTKDVDTIYVVNHSGSSIQVWVSRRCGSGSEEDTLVLEPGDDKAWKRQHGIREAIFVYKLDQGQSDTSDTPVFLQVPELHVGNPGEVLSLE